MELMMRLLSFSVKNYRSITVAHKISTGNLTVLVGKNNEGKSNILKSLILSMEIMTAFADNPRMTTRPLGPKYIGVSYSWERDFPVQLRGKSKNEKSTFDLEFELNENEQNQLKEITGIRLASTIVPIRINLDAHIAIDIPHKGSAAFKTHAQKIIEFVCRKIRFNYIPAVRTERDAVMVIESIISSELRTLDENVDYKEATKKIDDLQQQLFNRIATEIKPALCLFLPSIKNISITPKKKSRRVSLATDLEVVIDDGVPTEIQSKGDGVKSLTALAMLNKFNNYNEFASVIAIEEPESHLHPEAIHQLYETIINLTAENQIILTTHSPLFVNRDNPQCNVIVGNGEAKAAKNVKEIREVLGILVSDNLINANYIIVVEGEDDKLILTKMLPLLSEKIKKVMKNNSLIICSINGASNLSFHLSHYRNYQCKYHVLLDHDQAGHDAYLKAEAQKLISMREVTFTICNGSPIAEFEDCLNKNAYATALFEEFGVNIDVSEFKGKKKWSDRLRECFLSQGKPWNNDVEQQVKFCVAKAIPCDPEISFNVKKRSCIDALVVAVEAMIV